MNIAWLFLLLAIGTEIAGTTCMKASHGLTRLVPSILLFVFYASSLTSLTFALKKLDISLAYAIWSGLGTAIIAVIGTLYFKEPLALSKVACLALIIAGVIGLNLCGGSHS